MLSPHSISMYRVRDMAASSSPLETIEISLATVTAAPIQSRLDMLGGTSNTCNPIAQTANTATALMPSPR